MTEYLTIVEVAAELSVSRRHVLAELKRKNLRGALLPAGWRITRDDLQAYVDAHANVARVRGRS